MARRIQVPVEIPPVTFEEMPDVLVEMADVLRKMSASSVALSKLAQDAETSRVTELREKLTEAEKTAAEWVAYADSQDAKLKELETKLGVSANAPMVTAWVKIYSGAGTVSRFHTKMPCPSGRAVGPDFKPVTLSELTMENMRAIGAMCGWCMGEHSAPVYKRATPKREWRAKGEQWWPRVGQYVKLAPNENRAQWTRGVVRSIDKEHGRVMVVPSGHRAEVAEDIKYVRAPQWYDRNSASGATE
jgi:hypothetical protein